MLFDAFRGMLDGKLTNEEIEIYARSVEVEGGFTEEDYETVKERLQDFKTRYCA